MASQTSRAFGAVSGLLHRLLAQSALSQDEGTAPALRLVVECAACGEVIRARVEKAEELQAAFDDDDRVSGYTLTKELVGARCRNLVHLEVSFDERQRPRKVKCAGGRVAGMECCG